ncbi:Non-canonical poly(A) RNA polymerase PAPD7 [Phytophthora citrophthora]|uniref:Non-canonical poly(A) RNA polymerase PAPD7 n=1 Tax=Phytophthora citrophthora TaxID=4793 RepID=A0AAD9LRS9_9STRA|nr:Non-canonical poly(A) RNA polymerase PAPD7 [Phytophthora citrophthora]
MKPRDAAFMVDHRRQLSGASAASPVRKDEEKNKTKRQVKAATIQQQQQPYKPPKTTPSLPAAQFPSKSAKKNAKKKENKAKLAAQALQDPADLLHQDSVKSRNHKLVLAPATSATTSSSSFCVSSNFPSWGAKKKKQEQMKPTLMAMNANRAVTDALHEEILEYTKYTKKTVERMAVHIEEMIANVRVCVQSLWPQSKVEAFGSYSTGIWLPSSDVDLVILDVVEVNDSKLTAKHLRELANVLEKKKWVESLLCLDTAKVPVLKLVSAETSVPIDITFESAATHSGLLARDLIKRYADNMPELYPLAIVFKQLLRERDLNDAYTGGLSSYSVVLMIIHFSQLWRNGDSCFEAASIYASGSLPPAPSKMQAQKAAWIQAEAGGNSKGDSEGLEVLSSKTQSSTIALKKSASLPLPAPTSSYAAIVAKKQGTDDSSPSEPRFSYAAVAAGIAKVSEKKKPPSSYAAAVSARAGSSSATAKRKNVTTVKKQNQNGHSLDSISVSSSNADTEDSSSSCSHSSSTDSDDETQPQQPPVSLGQHLLMILEFFGIIFDYRMNGLSVRDGGYIYRLADNHRTHIGKPALVIEDPIHPDRNVSASSFAFSKVVALFEDSYYALKYFRATKFKPSALSCLLSTSGHTSHTNHIHSKAQAVRS